MFYSVVLCVELAPRLLVRCDKLTMAIVNGDCQMIRVICPEQNK